MMPFRVSSGGEFYILRGCPWHDHVYPATGVPADLHVQRVRLLALFAGKKGILPAGRLFAADPDYDGGYESHIQP